MLRALADHLDRLPDTGSFSVWCGPLRGAPYLLRDEAVTHYAASTMKLPLLLAAYRLADRGELDLDAPVLLHDDFPSVYDGSVFRMSRPYDNDEEPWERMGDSVPLRWLGRRSLVRSSNLGANLVLEAVGLAEVEATLLALGAEDTRIRRGIEDYVAADAGVANLVSARDLAAVLRAIGTGVAASGPACAELIEVLAEVEYGDGFAAGLPPGTRIAAKSGWVDGIRHDAGIVYPADAEPFVLVMLASAPLEQPDLLELVAGAAAAAWQDLGRTP